MKNILELNFAMVGKMFSAGTGGTDTIPNCTMQKTMLSLYYEVNVYMK